MDPCIGPGPNRWCRPLRPPHPRLAAAPSPASGRYFPINGEELPPLNGEELPPLNGEELPPLNGEELPPPHERGGVPCLTPDGVEVELSPADRLKPELVEDRRRHRAAPHGNPRSARFARHVESHRHHCAVHAAAAKLPPHRAAVDDRAVRRVKR